MAVLCIVLAQLIGASVNTDEQMALLGDTTWKLSSRDTRLCAKKNASRSFVVLFIAHEAEGWGRDCALNPTHDPNC